MLSGSEASTPARIEIVAGRRRVGAPRTPAAELSRAWPRCAGGARPGSRRGARRSCARATCARRRARSDTWAAPARRAPPGETRGTRPAPCASRSANLSRCVVTKPRTPSSGRSERTRRGDLLPLGGVGPRAELVEDDERAGVELVEAAPDPQELHPEVTLGLIGSRLLEQRREEARRARQARGAGGREEAALGEELRDARSPGAGASCRPSSARSRGRSRRLRRGGRTGSA